MTQQRLPPCPASPANETRWAVIGGMAGFIDDEAEGADLVVLGRNEEAAFLGNRVTPPAPRGDDLGEAGMVIRIDR